MKTKTALLAAFLLTACAIGRAEVFEQILVKVNGEIFTKAISSSVRSASCVRKGSRST